MPIFRMPVILHANCPHANSPVTFLDNIAYGYSGFYSFK